MTDSEDITRRQSSGQRDDEGNRCAKHAVLQRSQLTLLIAYKLCLFTQIFSPESSFYPGLNGINSILDVENDNLADDIPDEAHFEFEDDWIEAPPTAEVSRGQPNKISKGLASEVRSRYFISTFILYSHLTETDLDEPPSHEWTTRTYFYHPWWG
jgi:hypothetical protein